MGLKMKLKFGDIRENGMVFSGYCKDGSEHWLTKQAFNKRLENYKKMRSTEEGRSSELLRSAKSRCKQRKKGEVTITKSWIHERLSKGFCELSGLKFDLSQTSKGKANPFAPSLDRKDSENPNYSETNTRVVLTAVNTALNEHGLLTMLPIFEAIIARQKGL